MRASQILYLIFTLTLFAFLFGTLPLTSATIMGSGSFPSDINSAQKSPTPEPSATPAFSELPITQPINIPAREPHYSEYLNAGLGSDDVDCDGVKNESDNCVIVFNPDQKSNLSAEYGDACNPKLKASKRKDLRCDRDGDGLYDEADNCPLIPNPDQTDCNHDQVGDACDQDIAAQKADQRCKAKMGKPSKQRRSKLKSKPAYRNQ